MGLKPVSSLIFICPLRLHQPLWRRTGAGYLPPCPLLLQRQCRLVGLFVFLCRCLSRCDIHPVAADTAKSTSASTKETKNAFRRTEMLQSALQHSFPVKLAAPVKRNYLHCATKSTLILQIRGKISSEKHWFACPIHENVVLRSSGDIWLAGKRRTAIGCDADIFCVDSALGPVTPDALLSSPAMFAAPRTRSLAPLGCTLSSHYFCYSNSSINYALE